MSTEYPDESLNDQILAEASEWLVEFETGADTPEARRKFDEWLRRSPEHVRAYLGLLPIWKQGVVANFSRDQGPQALIDYAQTEGNVVPLPNRDVGSGNAKRQPLFSLELAAVLVLALVAGLFAWSASLAPTYTTGIGEQHSLLLPDGSTLELNARSRVRTDFTERLREVELLEGQAQFNVAPDSLRPFIVRVDQTQVRAVGTRFDVNRRARSTIVTVVEGRVSVGPPASSHDRNGVGESMLSAGEQVTINPGALQKLQPRTVNPAATTAWTQRRLVFDASSLAEVVEELNRYNNRSLSIADPSLDQFPITGSFSSTSPASLLRFLEAQPGIVVETTDDAIRILARR